MEPFERRLDKIETREQAKAYGLYLQRQLEEGLVSVRTMQKELEQLNKNWNMGMQIPQL